MSSPKPRPDDARRLFSSLDQIHLVYIHPNGLKVGGRDFGKDVDEAMAAAERANADGANVYWTVNAVRVGLHKKPEKADIVAARFAHVDIDPPKSGGAFDKDAIVDALAEIAAPPSFVIDSGNGLQAFWRLSEPVENWQAVEAINMQARFYFEADACQNIDRLMRVPGFVNWPDRKKAARGRVARLASWAAEDDGVVYEPQVLVASFPPAPDMPAAQATRIHLPAHVEMETPDSLGLSTLDPVRAAIECPPGVDRSGDGLAAARLLANAGHTDAQIVGVLLNPENAVSAHYLDQRDPHRAAMRTLMVVRADSPAEDILPVNSVTQEEVDAIVASARKRVAERMTPAAFREDEAEQPRRTGTPGWRRDLGDGPLAQFVDYVTDTGPSPQPWVALGAALAVFGTAAGRRYASPSNLRTNIYSIGIVDSGGGKDYPLRACTRLMIAAGLANHIGGSKIASGSGLVTAVTRNPSILFPLDEVGFLIASAADRKRSSKHVVEILDNLTEFYSLADSTFLGTAYANDKEKPREVIEQPCLSLFGVTTPGIFWGSLSSGNVLDGSLARMLVFESDNHYPDPQLDIVNAGLPESLIDAIQAVAAGVPGQNPFPLGNNAETVPKPYVVPYADHAATIRAREMRQYQIEMLRKHQGTNVTGIIARLAENAAKIALVKAISERPENPAIQTHDLDWGMEVASASVNALMAAVRERVADNEQEAKLKRLHRIICDAGSAGIGHEDLFRKARFMGTRRQLGEALDFLAEGASIRVEDFARADGGKGKKRRVYFDIE